jgi:exosome complex component RRP40
MGELKGGMLFDISMGMARRLLMAKQREDGGVAVLEEIAEKVAFEIAVGRNGKVWVKSGGVKETLLVGRALQEADVQGLTVEEQVKLVRKMIKQV